MSHNLISIDPEICNGCKRCVKVCPVDAIQGAEGTPQTIDKQLCVACGQCVQVCSVYASELDTVELTPRPQKLAERGLLDSVTEPLFAAYAQAHTRVVKQALLDKNQYTIVQSAPAVRVAIAEEFGMPLGHLTPGKLAAALRRLGFDRVYDTNFGADITIMEEGSELLERVIQGQGKLPMFTSCCPAWVKYIEQDYPELLDHLSTCKSPMGMAAPVFKTYGAEMDQIEAAKIFSVAVMPCTCKEFEAARPEMNASGYRDTDVVITTRELAQLIKDQGIDFVNLPDEAFDQPFGEYSGAGAIFGVTGGVMEAALRTGYELATGQAIPRLELDFVRGDNGLRTADVAVGDLTIKIAVVAGLDTAAKVLERVKAGTCDYHFIEVMTCPEGCMTGGGQPKLLLDAQRKEAFNQRRKGLYSHDTNLEFRKSHENPSIIRLYKDHLGEPLGHNSHHLLHTSYVSRKKGVN